MGSAEAGKEDKRLQTDFKFAETAMGRIAALSERCSSTGEEPEEEIEEQGFKISIRLRQKGQPFPTEKSAS